MKNRLLITLLFSCMIRVYAQVEYKEIPTEIKTNGLYFAIVYYNISTECLINKNWSLVLSIYFRENVPI